MNTECETYYAKDYDTLIRRGYFYQLIRDRKLTKIFHKHDFYEIVCVLGGEVFHNIDGRVQRMEQGDFTFLSTQNAHCYESQSSDAYLLSLSVMPNKYSQLLSALEIPPIFGKIHRMQNATVTETASLLPALPVDRQKPLVHTIIANLLCATVALGLPDHNDVPQSLQIALQQIRLPEHICGGVAELAALSNYSSMHLGRLIKQYYNKTPYELLHDVRMQLATEYLQNSSFTVEQISDRVGFSSVSQFHSTFKKYFGCTPRAYRNEHKIILS